MKDNKTQSKLYVVISKSTWNKNGVATNYKYYGEFSSIKEATLEAFKKYGSENILEVQEV